MILHFGKMKIQKCPNVHEFSLRQVHASTGNTLRAVGQVSAFVNGSTGHICGTKLVRDLAAPEVWIWQSGTLQNYSIVAN